MMGDQRGMVIQVFKGRGGGNHFELGDDGGSEGKGDKSV